MYADKGVVSSYYQYANGQNGTKMPGLTIIVRMAGRGRHRRTSGPWNCTGRRTGTRAADVHAGPYGRPDGRHYTGSRLTRSVSATPAGPKATRAESHCSPAPTRDHLTPVKLTHHGLQDRSEIRGQDRRRRNRRLHALRFRGRHGRLPRSVGPFRRLGILRGHGHHPRRTIPHDDRLQGRRQGRETDGIRQ